MSDATELEDEGGDHQVPVDLVELHEVLEWQAAVAAEGHEEGDE